MISPLSLSLSSGASSHTHLLSATDLHLFLLDSIDTGFAPEGGDPLTPLEESVLALSQGVQNVKDDQEYMLMRDIAHKSITDSTNRRVLLWFIFELALILALGLWQVFYVRRFFEVKCAV